MSVVYFVQMGKGGPIKIGMTGNLQGRMKALNDGAPDLLILHATVEGGRALEVRLHRALHASQRRLEWFNPTPEVRGVVVLAKEYGLPGLELWLQAKAQELEVRPTAFVASEDIDQDIRELIKLGFRHAVARHGKNIVAATIGRSVDRVEAVMLHGADLPFSAFLNLALLDPGAFVPLFERTGGLPSWARAA